jgi:dienelactone hydrolase
MDETVATALAEAGFASLALAYFGVTDLPDRLAEIPVETVERGLLWLRDHPSVGGLRVGLVGSSKGGELALLAASRFSEHLSAVVGFPPAPSSGRRFPVTAVTGSSPRVHPGRPMGRLCRSCATAARRSARS